VLQGQYNTQRQQGCVMYWEDYLLWAMRRALVAAPEWIDFTRWLLGGRIALGSGTSGWCKSIVTWYGAVGQYWAKPPYATPAGQGDTFGTGGFYANYSEAWTYMQPSFPGAASLVPCPGTLVFPGGNYGSYNCNHFAALNGLKQLGICDSIPGFLDYHTYVANSVRSNIQNRQTQPCWKQMVAVG
jgi:hypothetical protein